MPAEFTVKRRLPNGCGKEQQRMKADAMETFQSSANTQM